MNYRDFFTRERVRSLTVGLLLLGLSMIFQYYSGIYSMDHSSRFVGDLFLSNLPVVNMDMVIINGALFMVLLSVVLVIAKPKYLLFAIKAAALFIAIRSFFVVITHLGVYPGQIVPGHSLTDRVYVGLGLEAGYFFSGHTGLPFLMALVFWNRRFWRYLYFILSAVFGVSVLLAHVHYSIDVFAAPFMAYGIFKMAQYLFPKDYELTES